MTMRKTLRLVAIATLGLTLTSCVAVPLSTMWELSGMTSERFFANDPKQLRVAIRVDEAMKRGSGLPQMRIDIDAPSTRPICYAFALDPIDPRAAGEPRLDAVPPLRRWYAFALSSRGIESFDRARREVRTKDLEDANFSLNVTMDDVITMPKPGATTPLRIDVSLDRNEGYFTLIKEIDIKVEREVDGSHKAAAAATTKPVPTPGNAKDKPVCVPAV